MCPNGIDSMWQCPSTRTLRRTFSFTKFAEHAYKTLRAHTHLKGIVGVSRLRLTVDASLWIFVGAARSLGHICFCTGGPVFRRYTAGGTARERIGPARQFGSHARSHRLSRV